MSPLLFDLSFTQTEYFLFFFDEFQASSWKLFEGLASGWSPEVHPECRKMLQTNFPRSTEDHVELLCRGALGEGDLHNCSHRQE
jgi:hypothetical protein